MHCHDGALAPEGHGKIAAIRGRKWAVNLPFFSSPAISSRVSEMDMTAKLTQKTLSSSQPTFAFAPSHHYSTPVLSA
jgi:hypothetical protein